MPVSSWRSLAARSWSWSSTEIIMAGGEAVQVAAAHQSAYHGVDRHLQLGALQIPRRRPCRTERPRPPGSRGMQDRTFSFG